MPDNDIAIKVEHVSKSFKLPHERSNSLKSKLINFRKRGYEVQHALEDISFEVKKGEFLGIVGRNGSGKSTLLKMLAGIYKPNSGTITVNGKLTPFIELGVGFNPELSGRDNVFLNGALLGFTRKEMADMYNEIVEFAELERFMDQKLKNYSSGMQVRLAFSIAIRANTDILVLDEVLAVGDSNFQRKCFDYFGTLKKDKKTIILVTHDMSAVERFCDRAILIDNSKIITQGPPDEITRQYSDLNLERVSRSIDVAQGPHASRKHGKIKIKAELVPTEGLVNSTYNATIAKKVEFILSINSTEDISNAVLGIIVSNSGGVPVFATNSMVNKTRIDLKEGKTSTIHIIVDNIFSNGSYVAAVTLKDENRINIYYSEDNQIGFLVGGRKHDYAITSPDYEITTH